MSDIALPDSILEHSHAHSDTPDLHRSHDTRATQTEPIPEPIPEDIPASWEPPSSRFPRYIFHILCCVLTLHSKLDFMWEIFRKKEGWKNFHTVYLEQINQLSTMQGLILTSVAVFISAPPPVNPIYYTVDQLHSTLSDSLTMSLFGLLSLLCASIQGRNFAQQKFFETMKEGRWLFICHILVLSIPVYIFCMSVMLLTSALYMTSLMSSSQGWTQPTFILLMVYQYLGITLHQSVHSRWIRKSREEATDDELNKKRSKEAKSPA